MQAIRKKQRIALGIESSRDIANQGKVKKVIVNFKRYKNKCLNKNILHIKDLLSKVKFV